MVKLWHVLLFKSHLAAYREPLGSLSQHSIVNSLRLISILQIRKVHFKAVAGSTPTS